MNMDLDGALITMILGLGLPTLFIGLAAIFAPKIDWWLFMRKRRKSNASSESEQN